MGEIFRAYDIRGVYPEDINQRIAYDIGRAYATFLNCKKIVIGRDVRISSPELYEAIVKGVIDSGCDVLNIGVVSTPILYFANTFFKTDGSIMITASHNPKEFNGFKLCRENTIPLGKSTGLKEIKRILEKQSFAEPDRRGIVYDRNIDNDYYVQMLSFLNIKPIQKFKVVCDYANSVGVVEAYGLKSKIDVIDLYERLDGNIPNHDADPAIHGNLRDLSNKVRESDAHFGVGFDGDADRIGFVDENGNIIPSDLITALLAKEILNTYGPSPILYDLRSSKAVKETIESYGGTPIKLRVGNSFIKERMRESNSLFAGELSGHFYFKDNSFAESSLLAIVHIINLLSRSDKPLSKLVQEIKKYAKSEEINLEIDNKDRVLENLEIFYYKGVPEKIDGLTLDFGNWWFNIRVSNTENYMRLNIEADTPELLKEKKYELLKTIEKITAHEI